MKEQPATITVTATRVPKSNPLTFSYTPTDTTGTYLKPDADSKGSTESRTLSLMFTENTNVSPSIWEATFNVETKVDDQVDMPNGVITVVLDQPAASAEYTVLADPNDRVIINVKDLTVPAISIVNAPDVIALNSAQFTLTALVQPHQPLTIRFTATNTTGNFLDVANKPASGLERTEDITFAPPSGADTPITGILPIPTTIDEDEKTGVITIQLLADSNTDDPGYSIDDQNNSGTVAVTNPIIPEISIANAELTLNGNDARFTLTSNIATAQQSIMIKPSNVSGNFFDPDGGPAVGSNRPVDVTFTESNGTYTAPLIIKTKIDNANASGEIEVELIDESTTNSYNIVDDQKTATVQVYRVRTLSIASAVPHVIEGVNELVFTVTSDLNPGDETIPVFYTVTEETTNFLTESTTSGTQYTTMLNFNRTDASSPWVASIIVPLRNAEPEDSGIGSITVELDDPPTDPKYEPTTGPNVEAKVATYDRSQVPILRIEDASAPEGTETNSSLEFKVTLTQLPHALLRVDFRVVTYQGDAIRALRGRDFELTPGDFEFSAETGATLTHNITATIIGDD